MTRMSPNGNLSILAVAAAVSLSTLIWTVYSSRTRSRKMRILLDDIFEFAPDGIFLVAPDGEILLANKQAEVMFGHEHGELTGKRVEELIPERLQEKHIAYRNGYTSQPRARAMGSDLTLFGKRKDGSEFPVDIMLSPLQQKPRPAVMAIVRDITERTRTEMEKIDATNNVARSVAHDLRNPLAAIAAASYLLDSETKMTEQGRRMLALINRNIWAAERIVSNLLDFSSAVKPKAEELRIDLLLKDALAGIVIPSNVNVVDHCEGIVSTRTDQGLLKRAVTNLIANALDSMSNGGTLSLGCRSLNNQIRITIADTGTGMSAETIAKLGTLFFTTKAKGMGIGFATSKRFVEGAGSTLELTSQLGKGTIVTVKLPRVP